MDPIRLKKSDVKPLVELSFPDYRGRTFRAVPTREVTFYNTNWDGGSRSQYAAVRMNDGKAAVYDAPAPWNNPVEGTTFALPPDVVIVEHIIFCGKDLGLRFYVHPERLKHLLPREEAQ